MPVAPVQYNNEGEIVEAEVWDGDDFIVLEKGEFAVFQYLNEKKQKDRCGGMRMRDDNKEKEIFVGIIMDLLMIIDLDGVSQSTEKENRMTDELYRMDWTALNNIYNQAFKIVKMQSEIEVMDKILKEIKKNRNSRSKTEI